LGEGVEMSSWLDGHSFIKQRLKLKKKYIYIVYCTMPDTTPELKKKTPPTPLKHPA
jgi:hypothetical protein